MMDMAIRLLPWVFGLVFQAGILYAAIRGMRHDMNGIGRKVRSGQETAEQRYLTLALIVMLSGVDDDKFPRYAKYAQFFLDAAKGRNL